jgi:hypothetical protein
MNIKHAPDWICPGCKDPSAIHMAKGLCKSCYSLQQRRSHGIVPVDVYREQFSLKDCIHCGKPTTSTLSICKACYMKQYRKENHERLYHRKCELREVDRFGGRRNELVIRAGGKCERCGLSEADNVARTGKRLIIHHRDGNGLSSPTPNHALDNLMLVCNSCHRKIHGEIGVRRAS